MSPWAKLLIVVVFVLSIIFASMSAVLFAKRQDYHDQLDRLQKTYDKDKLDLTSQLKVKGDKVDSLSQELTQANSDKAALETQLSGKSADFVRLEGEMKSLSLKFDAVTDTTKVQAMTIYTLGTQVASLDAAKLGAEKERDDLFGKLRNESARSNKLEKDNSDLTAKLETASKSLQAARDTIKLHEEVFAELSRQNIAWEQLIAKWATLPDIRGSVLTVDMASNMVVLNRGTDQGVKNNFEFTIWRDGVFVAKVLVKDVKKDMCAAQIIVQKDKTPIQRGDNAWTRM